MSQVKIDAKALRILHESAVMTGTVDRWALIALEWIDKAEKEIAMLRANLHKQNIDE